MKNYKDFEKVSIGYSDIATLILVGCRDDGLAVDMLLFGSDGIYDAYFVNEDDVKIGEHYKKVASFKTWMKVYDDCTRTFYVHAKEINVYTAGSFGCIIHTIGFERAENSKDVLVR